MKKHNLIDSNEENVLSISLRAERDRNSWSEELEYIGSTPQSKVLYLMVFPDTC